MTRGSGALSRETSQRACTYTGIDPFTKKPVHTANDLRDRQMRRALMPFFKPENYFEVREALIQAGRAGLTGGCEGRVPADPPKEATEARRKQANRAAQGYFVALAPRLHAFDTGG